MEQIIETICEYYNLHIHSQIPDDQLYSMAYYLYILLCSEFTERMITFYANYIIQNIESLLNSLNPEDRTIKTAYAKKVYVDQNRMIAYDNMSKIIDILSGLDIPFIDLISYLSDNKLANYIATYIEDAGDIYQRHFAIFLKDQGTKTDLMTAIRLKFVAITVENEEFYNPITNPYIGESNE